MCHISPEKAGSGNNVERSKSLSLFQSSVHTKEVMFKLSSRRNPGMTILVQVFYSKMVKHMMSLKCVVQKHQHIYLHRVKNISLDKMKNTNGDAMEHNKNGTFQFTATFLQKELIKRVPCFVKNAHGF